MASHFCDVMALAITTNDISTVLQPSKKMYEKTTKTAEDLESELDPNPKQLWYAGFSLDYEHNHSIVSSILSEKLVTRGIQNVTICYSDLFTVCRRNIRTHMMRPIHTALSSTSQHDGIMLNEFLLYLSFYAYSVPNPQSANLGGGAERALLEVKSKFADYTSSATLESKQSVLDELNRLEKSQ